MARRDGLPVEDHIGKTIAEVAPGISEQTAPLLEAALRGEAREQEIRTGADADAQSQHAWLAHWFPVFDLDGGGVVGAGVSLTDITEARGAEQIAATYTAQQRALTEFTRLALDDRSSLKTILDHAVARVADVLRVPLARIVAVVPGANEVRYAAGIGWETSDEVTPIDARAQSYIDSVMNSPNPVRIEDITRETRLQISSALRRRGVVSTITCGLRGLRGNWGIVSAHSLEPRHFTDDECAFLNELANALSLAIAVKDTQQLQRDTISIASHELRTPLTSVIGLSQHLARRLGRDGVAAEHLELVRSLTAEAFRLNDTLDRWMGFAEFNIGLIRH